MHQIELFEEKENYITKATDDEIEVKQFSHNEFCDQAERLKLEKNILVLWMKLIFLIVNW